MNETNTKNTPRQASSSATTHPSKVAYWIAILGVLIEIGSLAYLAVLHFKMKYGADVAHAMCNLNETFNCVAVASSNYSELFGKPIALWGTITNVVLLALILMHPLVEDNRRHVSRCNLLLFAGFNLLVSIVMGVISLTQMQAYCLFCIISYVASIVIFFGLWKGLDGKNPKGPASRFQPTDVKPLIYSGIAILLGTIIANQGFKSSFAPPENSAGMDVDAQVRALVNEWHASPPLTIEPIAPLTKGSTETNPKMTIIEFADFRCSHCRDAYPTLDAFVKSHSGVKLMFQAYPLDGECNSAIEQANGASCALARAALCVGQQDSHLGWQAQSWLFARQAEFINREAVQGKINEMVAELKVDAAKFGTCVNSDETRKTIEDQAKLGQRLNVHGTPTIFVNGRQLVGGHSLPVLQQVYQTLK